LSRIYVDLHRSASFSNSLELLIGIALEGAAGLPGERREPESVHSHEGSFPFLRLLRGQNPGQLLAGLLELGIQPRPEFPVQALECLLLFQDDLL
jgi:hypothetical protein